MKSRIKSFLNVIALRRVVPASSFAVLMLLVGALNAHAVTTPAEGSFMYDAYDVVVNNLLKGPFGYVAAMFVFVTGIAMFFRQLIIPGVIAMVCTALIIKSDSIITSLGALIP